MMRTAAQIQRMLETQHRLGFGAAVAASALRRDQNLGGGKAEQLHNNACKDDLVNPSWGYGHERVSSREGGALIPQCET